MDENFKFPFFHFILSLGGVRIFSRNNSNSMPWLIFQTFNVFIAFLTLIFTTGFVIVNTNDISLWFEGACIWTSSIMMFISLGVWLVFRNEFREFIGEMAFQDVVTELPLINHVLNSNTETKGKLKDLKEITIESQENLLKYTRILLKVYVTSMWLTASMYVIDTVYKMITGDDNFRLLAFKMWFPWSLQDFNVYIASFIFHVYAAYPCCTAAYAGLQSTIVLLNAQIIRQLKILTFIITYLDELVKEIIKDNDKNWQCYCTDVFIQCVKHWIKLKRFTNRLNKICRYFYLTLILVAIFLVCVCSVKIAISNKFAPDTIKYYAHALCFILTVLMFCYLGQQVQNECERLETAVTEKWYKYNRVHKVNIKIFQMALGQGMPIYIFGTIPLSLPTFTWFINTEMSFFTLMMSVLDNEE